MIKSVFGGTKKKFENREDKEIFEAKSRYMEAFLGKEYKKVTYATTPFHQGGTLDLYYYPNFRDGTGIATKELVDHTFSGGSNDWYDAYELVMCTKHGVDLSSLNNENPQKGTFAYDHKFISLILNSLAKYSVQNKLNPYQTLEFPIDHGVLGGKCLILDAIPEPITCARIMNKKFGLMMVIEIHRSEMEYAIQNQGLELIKLLKRKGVYPFSGIDRDPINETVKPVKK